MPEDPKASPVAASAEPIQDRSDGILVQALGRDLMTATMRSVAFIAVAAIVLATIAALVG